MVDRPEPDAPPIPLTFAVGALCVAIFLGLNVPAVTPYLEPLLEWVYPPHDPLGAGAAWTLVTSAVVHREVWHLAFNMLWLWVLGGAMERSVGSVLWLPFVLLASWVSSSLAVQVEGVGIGMSGVIYAFFGFGWLTRERYPEFRHALSDGLIKFFLIWLVAGFVLTYTNILPIGNAAHVGGLLFGAAVGAVVARPRFRLLAALGLGALVAVSILPVVRPPQSAEAEATAALHALREQDYPTAIDHLHRSLELGYRDPAWVWQLLALTYHYAGDETGYAEALAELRRLDPAAADQLEAEFGPPPEP